jgi:HPt (histidine-containing phosphotransfer) domain-containing protein
MRAAHAFRGAAATIGAHTLADLLQSMEVAAGDGDVQRACDELARVQEAATAVIQYLQRGSDHRDAKEGLPK